MTVDIECAIQITPTGVLQMRALEQELDVLGEQINHAESKRVVAARVPGDRTVRAVVRPHKARRYVDFARNQAEAGRNGRSGPFVDTDAVNPVHWVEQVLMCLLYTSDA